MNERKFQQVKTILMQHFSPRDAAKYHQAALDVMEELEERQPTRADTEPLIGFQIIGEMSKEDLIAECVAFQINQWRQADMDVLKTNVIQARLYHAKERYIAEAKMSPPMGFIGWSNPNE